MTAAYVFFLGVTFAFVVASQTSTMFSKHVSGWISAFRKFAEDLPDEKDRIDNRIIPTIETWKGELTVDRFVHLATYVFSVSWLFTIWSGNRSTVIEIIFACCLAYTLLRTYTFLIRSRLIYSEMEALYYQSVAEKIAKGDQDRKEK